jgi:hypothetical protein
MTKRVSIDQVDDGFILELYDPDDFGGKVAKQVASTPSQAVSKAKEMLGIDDVSVKGKKGLLPSEELGGFD